MMKNSKDSLVEVEIMFLVHFKLCNYRLRNVINFIRKYTNLLQRT